MKREISRPLRILLLAAPPVLAALVCLRVYRGGHVAVCAFYELTGLYCPGCGSGRAVYALLHGDWRGAFRHNWLLLPLGVPAGLVFLHEYARMLLPGLGLKPVRVPSRLAAGCCALIVLFWILRNLPAFAFLAP